MSHFIQPTTWPTNDERSYLTHPYLPGGRTIDCMFHDLSTGLHIRKQTKLRTIAILHNLGHQMSIGLYVITHICVNPFTISVFFSSSSLNLFDLDIARSFVVDPNISNLLPTHRATLERLGVLTVAGKLSSFPPARWDRCRRPQNPSQTGSSSGVSQPATATDPGPSVRITPLDVTDNTSVSWRDALIAVDPRDWLNAVVIRFLDVSQSQWPDDMAGRFCGLAWHRWMRPISVTATYSTITVVMEPIQIADKVEIFRKLHEEREQAKAGNRGVPEIVIRKNGTMDFARPEEAPKDAPVPVGGPNLLSEASEETLSPAPSTSSPPSSTVQNGGTEE